METVIEPVQRELIEKELTDNNFLRNSHYGGNKIYTVNNNNSPNIMREIGRLRELAFRNAGGGTGKSIDIDEFDIHPTHPYEQLWCGILNQDKYLEATATYCARMPKKKMVPTIWRHRTCLSFLKNLKPTICPTRWN